MNRKIPSILRYFILLSILVLVSFQIFSHGLGNKTFSSVHGICPFGGLESIYFFITRDGSTPAKIFSGTLGLFFVTLIIILLFRRSFCGLICPLGTLQEIFSLIGRKLFGKNLINIPSKIDKYLRLIKYPILFFILAMTIITGRLWFQSFDPWTAYGHIINFNDLFGSYLIGFIILIVSLILSIFTDRFFCKYACPMGAFNSIVGFFVPYKIKREKDICINCGLCEKECPVQIPVDKLEIVNTPECINCDKCIHICPVPGAVNERFWGIKLNPLASIIIIIFIYFIGIFIFQFAGYDRYTGVASLTLREIAKNQKISNSEFKKQYGLPKNFSDRSTEKEIEFAMPLYKVAELSRQTPEYLKEMLELPPDTNNNLEWGNAYGMVRLEVIARLNRATVEQYISYFNLDSTVNKDTKWKDIRKKVESVLEQRKVTEKSGCGNESSCTGQ